jgi:hypothetical protein
MARNKSRGRPAFVLTGQQRLLVKRLAGLLVSHREIAREWITPRITENTLRKHFRAELDRADIMTRARLRMMLLREAEEGNVSAMTYLLARIDPEFAHADKQPPAGTGAAYDDVVTFYKSGAD